MVVILLALVNQFVANCMVVFVLTSFGNICVCFFPSSGGQQHLLSHDTARGRQGRDDHAQVKRISDAADAHADDTAADAGSAHLPQLSAKGWIRGSAANHVVSFVVTVTAVAVGTVAVGLMSLSLGLPVVKLEGMPPLLLGSDPTKVALAILAGACCTTMVGLLWWR